MASIARAAPRRPAVAPSSLSPASSSSSTSASLGSPLPSILAATIQANAGYPHHQTHNHQQQHTQVHHQHQTYHSTSSSPSHAGSSVAYIEEKDAGGNVTTKIKSKLDSLGTRFDGFEDELNLSRNKKKADEDKRVQVLQTQLSNLQSSLALESKNRAMSVKALQNWLTDRISAWTEQIEAPMTSRLATLSTSIVSLTTRLENLEQKQKEDRALFPKLVDSRCEELLRDVSVLRSKFESNLLAREEKEKRILLKLQNESNKIAVQFNQDKLITDERMRQVRESIDAEVAVRARGAEMVKETLAEEVGQIKADIAKEKAQRESADEDLVQAINHYAAALQDGIKIVSTQ